MTTSERVVIGMDPHKWSVTIEVMTADETVLGGGRFGTDIDGFRSMSEYVKQWPVAALGDGLAILIFIALTRRSMAKSVARGYPLGAVATSDISAGRLRIENALGAVELRWDHLV